MNRVFCIGLGAAALLLIWGVWPDQTLFGSETDWISQHCVFPEYFRQQFEQTGSLFPDFAMELGDGQNIYNFAYYGLFSPVILASFLMPEISMESYLQAVSIGGTVCSVVLFFIWLKGKRLSSWAAFTATICFLCAAPLIFHAHRQIMFVSYMPFLLLALTAVDRCPRVRWYVVFYVAALGCILSSYFFSVGCFASLGLYIVSEKSGYEMEKCTGKN